MPRKRQPFPAYCHHKPTNQAYVRITRPDGTRETVYLGVYGTEESRAEYARVVNGRAADEPAPRIPHVEVKPLPETIPAPARGVPVKEFVGRFMAHARTYYRLPSGEESFEVRDFELSFRELLRHYAETPVEAIGKAELKAVRDDMVKAGLSRKVVNQRIGRIKRAFMWGAEEGLVPDAVAVGLKIVRNLQRNRTEAKDHPDVVGQPVADVLAAAGQANPIVAGMMRLQLWTGMRPGEVVGLAPGEIDRSGLPWIADLSDRFKMAYKGLKRVVYLGPKARELLAGLARWEEPEAPVFRPSDSAPDRPSLAARYSASYSLDSYGQAIERACKRAGVEAFSPNQIRHTHATAVRRLYGLEGAQVALGHENAAVTEIYAERDLELARRIAEEMG